MLTEQALRAGNMLGYGYDAPGEPLPEPPRPPTRQSSAGEDVAVIDLFDRQADPLMADTLDRLLKILRDGKLDHEELKGLIETIGVNVKELQRAVRECESQLRGRPTLRSVTRFNNVMTVLGALTSFLTSVYSTGGFASRQAPDRPAPPIPLFPWQDPYARWGERFGSSVARRAE